MACEGRALAQQVACEAFFSFRGRRRRRPASSSFFGCGHRKEKKQTGICSPARSSGCFQAFPLSRGGRIYVLDLYAAVRKERKTQLGEGQLLLPHVKQARERPPLFSLSLSLSLFPFSPPSLQLPSSALGQNYLLHSIAHNPFHRLERQREGESARLGGAKVPGVESRNKREHGERSRWWLASGLFFFFSFFQFILSLPKNAPFPEGLAATSP